VGTGARTPRPESCDLSMNTSTGKYKNSSIEERDQDSSDPYSIFLGTKRALLIQPEHGRPFVGFLIGLSALEISFEGLRGMKSIYKRQHIRSIVELEDDRKVY
jgi:hypothetical protein